jgi:hypothetical protein
MRERFLFHVGSHLRLFLRSRIVLGVGLVILGIWALGLLPMLFGASNTSRFNQLGFLANRIALLGWLLSAALGLFVTSTHLRNRSLQMVLTRPGSPQLWLASVFAAALIVATALQAIGVLVTLGLSLAWGVPYQIGFLYVAIEAVFQAAIVIAMLTTLGAIVHPVVALLAVSLFNENTFLTLRFGLELAHARGGTGWLVESMRHLAIGIHTALPMLSPFETQTGLLKQTLRAEPADWGYLAATAAYSLAVTAVCFLLADLALRRRSFASTA